MASNGIDGSFLEDIETRETRPPKDLDVVTVYWGYDLPFQTRLVTAFPEVANPVLAKANYSLGSLSLRRRVRSGGHFGADALLDSCYSLITDWVSGREC